MRLALLILTALAFTACANMTPEQIAATSNAITSVVATTGEVVTPLIVNYENGQSVKVTKPQRKRHAKPKPTPTP